MGKVLEKNENNVILKEVLKRIKDSARDEIYRNMRLILNTNEKAENFLSYVKGMCNDCLELDCIAYRQLVLNNRKYNVDITKKRLQNALSTENYMEIHNELRNMLLEDITIEEVKDFIRETKNKMFIDNFLDFWDKRKGIPFSNLLYMYRKLSKLDVKKIAL